MAKAEPPRLPPKKPPPPKQPKFDADKIAALLDQRAPQRQAVTGAEPSVPTLGTAMGNAAKLSQSELDALRARLMALWNPPVGIQNPEDFVIRVRIQLNRNGRLTTPPTVLTSGTRPIVRQRARQRDPRGVPRPALRYAQAGALRHLEGHRSDLRPARNVRRRLTRTIDSTKSKT